MNININIILLFFIIGNLISQNTYNPKELSVKSMIELHTLFINSNGAEGQKLIANNINFKGIYMRGENLKGAKFVDCDFSYSSIYNSKLNNTIFLNCDFSNSKMWSTDFEDTTITSSNFENIQWKECNFIDSEIKECITNNSNFYKSKFIDTELTGRQEELPISNLNNNFSETIIERSSFEKLNLNN